MISIRDLLLIVLVVIVIVMIFHLKAYPLVLTGPLGLLLLVVIVVMLVRG